MVGNTVYSTFKTICQLLEMRNMLLTMREDVEQESNDHHPVR